MSWIGLGSLVVLATLIVTSRTVGAAAERVALKAQNAQGEPSRELRIVVGPQISLTPPLGWNSWNCYAETVDQFDDFTLNLLTNDEVLEVNQDPFCAQAQRLAKYGPIEVWGKPLEDGSLAVGATSGSRLKRSA